VKSAARRAGVGIATMVAFFTFLALAPASGSDAEIGEIVRRMAAQDQAVQNQRARVVIRQVDALSGAERTTSHSLYWKSGSDGNGLVGRTLLITLTPPDQRGEAFLLWQSDHAADSQAWLYLPELRQTRRVPVSPAQHDHAREHGASNSGLGFEQLGTRLAGSSGAVVGREVLDGADVVIVEQRVSSDLLPLRRFWISPAQWTIEKIEYRDAGGRLEKTQRIFWQQVDRAWVWKRSEIVSASSGTTVVELHDVEVNSRLPDRLFTLDTLKSGRIP